MEKVVDSNYFRAPELKQYLDSSLDNRVVVTDMAFFEMLKSSDPFLTASKSLGTVSTFPDRVLCTAGSGELMRIEVDQQKQITTPVDDDLTKRFRLFLRGASDYLEGRTVTFPLDHSQVAKERSNAMAQRLDHPFHKNALDGGVQVLRTKITPALQKQIRSGELTPDVYKFVYQVSFIGFRNVVVDYKLPEQVVEDMFLNYCFIARHIMVYALSCLRWFEVGGPEAMAAEKATNDLHDLDFVVMASYFDGILSREHTVNLLYSRMKDLFEMNIKDSLKEKA